MEVPDIGLSDLALIAGYVLILWLPGAAFGAAAGIRGWSLAAAAPLFTYSIAGLTAPLYSMIGVPWSPLTLALTTVVLTGVAYLARWGLGRPKRNRPSEPDEWSRRAHLGVAATVAGAAIIGGWVGIVGLHGLSTIPGNWDAVFHANGIRWIAETGDGSLFGMSQFNWYENGGIFYPNAYHLVGSVVYGLTGSPLPNILNVQAVLLPGMVALVLAALVRRFRGRAVLAAATGLVVIAEATLYDSMWRGPLFPFLTGAVLAPVVVILLVDYLDSVEHRQRLVAGAMFAIAVGGLVCLHSSMLFCVLIFILPVVVLRWIRRPALLRWEALSLAAAGVVTVVLLAPQLAGAMSSAAGYPASDWAAELSISGAVGAVVTFGYTLPQAPQLWLAALMVIGLVRYRWLGELRWIGVVALLFGTLFVLVAAVDEEWVTNLTRPWWNDRWRLAFLTAVPLCLIAGHGVAELQRLCAVLLGGLSRRWLGAKQQSQARPHIALTATAIVLVVLVVVSGGLAVARNAAYLAKKNDHSPVVSQDEIAAYQTLATVVPAGSRVLNDRGDGSVWMYALSGVRPTAGHWDANLAGVDAQLLAAHFRDYSTRPDVRAAARRLNVQYVVVGDGYLYPDWYRQSGLDGLDGADWLELIYRRGSVEVYRIRPDAVSASHASQQGDTTSAARPR